jgi:LL-diaminopimelate aminotransferase
MARANESFLKLPSGYLFPEIARRVREYEHEQRGASLIRLGIGDVTEPLPPAVAAALRSAVEDLTRRSSFRGYGPEQGYDFLREKIAEHDYCARGCEVSPDEVVVSDGAKCDTGNILDIFGGDNRIAVTDPVYPVYVDTSVMAGYTGPADDSGRFEGLVYLTATPENGFTPDVPDEPVDIIFLCYPNNPTGAVATRETLTKWVQYAKANGSIILFDAAYEAFITSPDIPHSIFEIPGARDVAIEFRSFSKTAGFTGVRCAYCVIPKSLTARSPDGQEVPLLDLWIRRHTTRFNGASYIAQRGAEAVYDSEGNRQVQTLIRLYMGNARIIVDALASLGLGVYGGENAPYVWVKTPGGESSWDFFDRLLREAQVVTTPGVGFGAAGEGFVRISAFNTREKVEEAVHRIKTHLSS